MPNTFKKEHNWIYGFWINFASCESVLFLGEKTWEKTLERREKKRERREKKRERREKKFTFYYFIFSLLLPFYYYMLCIFLFSKSLSVFQKICPNKCHICSIEGIRCFEGMNFPSHFVQLKDNYFETIPY